VLRGPCSSAFSPFGRQVIGELVQSSPETMPHLSRAGVGVTFFGFFSGHIFVGRLSIPTWVLLPPLPSFAPDLRFRT
jgi:hypothetical protein